jgi:hypothetical protein
MTTTDKTIKSWAELIEEHEKKFIYGHDIKYPLQIKGIVFRKFGDRSSLNLVKSGTLVAIRPVADEYKQKTYFGFYIGDMPAEHLYEFEKETQLLHIISTGNPAIFVFDLGKVIYGYESWWGEIKDEKQLRQITDKDIEDIWYVKALKQIATNKETNETE